MTKTVLVTGASGKIGTHAARAFGQAGWRVKQYKRGTDMTLAAKDADIIINGMNPAGYKNWAQTIPQITQMHIDAARASDATVVIPGNVYNFGRTSGVLDENSAHSAKTRKGRIRIEMEQSYAKSGVRTIILRAGNFIDPEANGDVTSLMHLSRVSSGKILAPGATDVRQAWCYLPDWAKAVVQLCETQDQLTRFEDIPFGGHTFSTETLKNHVEALTGKTMRISRFPWWLMQASSPFWSLAYEMLEMRYLWDLDHALSGDKLARLIPEFRATPLDLVIRAALSAKGIEALTGNRFQSLTV